MNSKLIIPKACFEKQFGFCLINHDDKKAYRFATKECSNFLKSSAYQSKSSDLWIKATHINQKEIDYPHQPNLELFEVDYIQNVFYWTEMSFFDIKKSLIKLCDICIFLSENNYSIQSHLWNIVLQKGQPILIDLGDFKHGSNKYLIFETVRSTLRERCEEHHCPQNFHGKIWAKNYKDVLSRINNLHENINAYNAIDLSKKLKDIILSIKINSEEQYWDSYPTQKNIPKDRNDILQYAQNNSGAKSLNLCKIISNEKPSTLIDIGCSRGLYSIYASLSCGTTCTGIDYSHNLVSSANELSKNLNLNNNFAFINLLNFKKYGFKDAYESFLHRFKCEMLIAPAVIHHLSGRGVLLNDIINQWCKITSNCLMIEYISKDTLGNQISLDAIKTCLCLNKFSDIKILDSNVADRKWIYAKKSNFLL